MNVFRPMFLVLSCVGFANFAAAQDAATTVTSEQNPPLKHTSIELRPLETAASAAPGIAAAGASVEGYLGHNFALAVGGSYADVNLPTKDIGTFEDRATQPIVDKGYGYTAGLTLRYYAYPIGSSFYGGLGTDYSEAHTGWTYRDERYQASRYAVTPSLVGGYRWVWNNGLLLRLGVGAGLPSVASSKVVPLTTGAQADEGSTKVKNVIAQRVTVATDLGLGMMF